MKLRTEIVDGDVFARGKSSLDKLRRLRHDAMAAHALLQAMGEWNVDNPGFADAYTNWLKFRAAEILAGWLGEE